MKWRALTLPPVSDAEAYINAVRLNSLGSLFFFAVHVLEFRDMARLHWDLCKSIEQENLHIVMEIPRGHFKTSLVTQAYSVWSSLPFTEKDELQMRFFGYDDAWIRWMRHAHNPNSTTLIVSEGHDNAIKMGLMFDEFYQNRALFKMAFPEIQPDSTCKWNESEKHHKSSTGHGEGTYDFLGVGQSLQSRHYWRHIQDDLVGKNALDSFKYGDNRIMEQTIHYHRQMAGAFNPQAFFGNKLGPTIVIGNRWFHMDLNGWIRKNEPWFNIESHSAEGGCCKLHKEHTPIFPEMYTKERLLHERKIWGVYDYAHQYLNQAMLPDEIRFKEEWLRYFSFKASRPGADPDDPSNVLMIQHETREGETLQDIHVGALHLRMIVDPNHAGRRGRSRHAIAVVGLDSETDRLYLIDEWAKSCGYSEFVDQIFSMAGPKKWNMREVWMETVAAQKYLKFYLDEKCRIDKRNITYLELPTDTRANAKDVRIDALEPLLKNGQFFTHRSHEEFLSEYRNFVPGDQNLFTKDVLDVVAYAPQTFEVVRRREMYQAIRQKEMDWKSRRVGPGGY